MTSKRPGPTWPDENEVQESVELHRERPYYGAATEMLICDPDVSDGAFRLYVYLSLRAGLKNNNIRSRSTMAADLHITSVTVRERIKQLVSAGWIAVVTRVTPSGDQTSNHYHVFESRETSATWRKTFKPTAHEKLQAIPPKPNKRKSRTGVGGRPKKAEAVAVDGVNSSLPVPDGVINSSLQPPETQVYPNTLFSNQPTKTPAAAVAAVSVPAEPPNASPPAHMSGTHAATSGQSLDELEAARADIEAAQLIEDERRLHNNEQRVLLRQAVTYLFNISGSRAEKYIAMLQGRSTIPKKSAWNEAAAELKGAPVTSDELTAWADWYRKTTLGGSKDATLTSSPDKLVGSILAYREQVSSGVRPVSQFHNRNSKRDYWKTFTGPAPTPVEEGK